METKVQKGFIDTGFGFPIHLINVPMVKVQGVWSPKINYNELAYAVLRALAHKESRLTGNEIKFGDARPESLGSGSWNLCYKFQINDQIR